MHLVTVGTVCRCPARQTSLGRLQVGALFPVAAAAEELQVLHRRRAAESDRDDVVVLKIKGAPAFHAFPAVALSEPPAPVGAARPR